LVSVPASGKGASAALARPGASPGAGPPAALVAAAGTETRMTTMERRRRVKRRMARTSLARRIERCSPSGDPPRRWGGTVLELPYTSIDGNGQQEPASREDPAPAWEFGYALPGFDPDADSPERLPSRHPEIALG